MWSKYPEIRNELKMTEDFIIKSMHSRNHLLNDIITDLVQAGGKRLRPAFVLISSKFGKKQGRTTSRRVVSLAGAFELLHTATLVHDDIIDRSKLRRGRITVSERYGMEMAVYVGDYLFTKSVLMLSDVISNMKLDIVAKSIKTICEGEVDQYQDKYNPYTTFFSYLKRISRKTAVLFSAACAAGGSLALSTPKTIRNLTKFGFYYGIAFQIRDDLNDFLLDTSTSDKPVNKDILEGIMTLPLIFAVEGNRGLTETLAGVFAKRSEITEEDVRLIMELVKENRGIEKAINILEKYIERGRQVLKKLPDNTYREMFEGLICDLKVKGHIEGT